MTPRRVVERYLAEVLNGGSAQVESLVSSDDVRQRVVSLRRAFPDLEVETVVLLAEGDLVAGHFVGRGTHNGLYQGVPPTGRRWDAAFTAVFRVDSGRIADAWVTWDRLTLLERLGAVERAPDVSA